MSESADVATTTVKSILIVTSIVGNCLVCAVIKRNRDMRIPFNYLLVNLAVADIMYSTFLIPELALSHIFTHPEGMAGKVLCTFRNGNFAWIGAISSVFTLVAIAFERYFAVIYPHGNKGKLTMRKLKVIIPCSWILSLIFNFPDFLRLDFVKEIDPRHCIWSEQWMRKAHVFMWNAFTFVPITLLSGLYSRIVFTLWLKKNDDNELSHQQQGVLKVRKRVTLMVVTVSVIFVICWGTDAILHLLEDVSSYKLSPDALPIAHTMVMFNSSVNPFAYALINQRFKEKMKGMLCCSSSSRAARVHAATPKTEGLELVITRPKDTAGPSLSGATEHAVKETEGVELANSTTKPSDTAGPHSDKFPHGRFNPRGGWVGSPI